MPRPVPILGFGIPGLSNFKTPRISAGAKKGGGGLLEVPKSQILDDLLWKFGQKTLQNFRPPSAARKEQNKGGGGGKKKKKKNKRKFRTKKQLGGKKAGNLFFV